MQALYSPPSEVEIQGWFSGYRDAFFLGRSDAEIVRDITTLFTNVYENFQRSRYTVGRTPAGINEDLRVFGFDQYDIYSTKPIRFYSNFRVPDQYQPLPTAGEYFDKNNRDLVWPDNNGRRWLASYIRNSAAHRMTNLRDGIVSIENKKPGSFTPDFHVFLPVREYFRLIAASLKNFVMNAVQDDQPGDKLGRLSTLAYCELIEFFQDFLKALPR